MTSSPAPTRSARMAACNAAVPLLTATPSAAPQNPAKAFSNCPTRGPVVSHSEHKVSTTALMSASPISWRPYGRKFALAWAAVRSGIGHLQKGLEATDVEGLRIGVARIGKAFRHRHRATGEIRLARRRGEAGQDHIAILHVDGPMGVVGRDHGLVQLLAGTDADDVLLELGID